MHLRETLEAYQRNDPAARSKLEVLLLYNGVHAILLYRLSHWLWWEYSPAPGPVLLSTFIALVGAAAGEVMNQRTK
jgi:serine acetyltransferase